MTWFSLPPFCALCNGIPLIASLLCHCYGHGAELGALCFQSSHQGGALGWGALGRGSSSLEMDWERLLSWGMGMGMVPSLSRETGPGEPHWEGLKLLLTALLGAAGQCPHAGGALQR